MTVAAGGTPAAVHTVLATTLGELTVVREGRGRDRAVLPAALAAA